MNEDSICLLKECNAGCKTATDSMEQVMPYVEDDNFRKLIDKYNEPHIKIGDECHQLLNEHNKDEQDPNGMTKAFSWVSTELKLWINDDTKKIAKIMMDGCNMGIQSLSEYINKYVNASKESIDLAKKLVKTEQNFMDELKEFL
jgi:hypothetical protein